MAASVEVTSHVEEVKQATERAMEKAARMIGGSVAGHAADACPVDTGLLRNSITFAIGGEAPKITDYTSDTKDKDGNLTVGHYDGEAPDDEDHVVTVYVGTNVHYAPYNELGTVKMEARPFLRPAMEGNRNEISQIILKCLNDSIK